MIKIHRGHEDRQRYRPLHTSGHTAGEPLAHMYTRGVATALPPGPALRDREGAVVEVKRNKVASCWANPSTPQDPNTPETELK